MKYIDAERLRAEIERRKEEYKEDRCMSDYRGQIAYYKDEIYDDLLSFIDSLQQEQTDCHTVEDWIQHIKNADQLTKDVFSKGPYDVLYDALNHPYQHCYDAIKEFGELCFQVGVNSVKQEQPEPSCRTCGFYENNCPYIRGKLIPYPSRVCNDYTYSVIKDQQEEKK